MAAPAPPQNHVRGKRDQFVRIFARFDIIPLTPTNLDLHITPVRPTQLLKRFEKCRVAVLSAGYVSCCSHQDSDTTKALTLLRTGRERPGASRANNSFDEIAP